MNRASDCMPALLPPMTVPVLRTAHMRRLAAFYRDAVGFRVLQQVPGVLTYMAHGSVGLQLWQQDGTLHDGCRITVHPGQECIWQLYRRLARSARALLHEAAPGLQPWGAWEFSMSDIDGNRLVFMQWPGAAAAR